jgi:hypothetical protein
MFRHQPDLACGRDPSVNRLVQSCSRPPASDAAKDKEHAISPIPNTAIAVIGIDIDSWDE